MQNPATETPWRLSAAEHAAWRRDGFFVRRALFAAHELQALREGAEAAAAKAAAAAVQRRYQIDGNAYLEIQSDGGARATVQLEHRAGSQTIRVIEPVHTLHPNLNALVDDPRITVPMAQLVGAPRVALFTDKLNLKRPREGSGFNWHQDSPYWLHFCAHTNQLPNVLITLDEAHAGNGCFRVIRGSHKRGPLPGRSGAETLAPLFTNPNAFDARAQVAVEAPAGTLVFFSPHTVHGSQPNRSAQARRALVFTYQPADFRMFKIDRVRNAGLPAGAAR